MHKVLSVLHEPWAITPAMLEQIHDVYRAWSEGRETAWAAEHRAMFEARGPASEPADRPAYAVVDGVAIVEANGVIAQRMNLFSQISGGTSSQMIGRAVAQAVSDPAVDGIVLAIDSPGGTVAGTPELSALIRGVRGKKPISAWTDGAMASAAYWIASAADDIYISSNVARVGSIGIVAAHKDVSGAEEKAGVKTTEIAAGKYKRIASAYAPLTDAGKASIQEQVDYLYAVFVGQVADNRGVSAEQVLTKMAEGRIFTGAQAIDAGLVDGMASLEEVIASVRNRAAGRARSPQKRESSMLSAKEVREQHAAAAAEIEKEAAAAERARIRAIQDAALPGHEALIAQMIDSGASAGDAAIAILQAEKQLGARTANARAGEVEQPVKPAAPKTDEQEPSEHEKAAQAEAYAAEHNVDFLAAMETLFPGSVKL